VSAHLQIKDFEKQYKEHLSGFNTWDQKSHADDWTLYPENIGERLSIDETAVTKDELYTLLTNKDGHGGKGSLVATVAGTKTTDVVVVLERIPIEKRAMVKEVTLDMSNAMDAIIRASFQNAIIVTDRFHVQQLITEAVQDIRMTARRAALKEENMAIMAARNKKLVYVPQTYKNGDTKKQLLARSFHALFKASSKWTDKQKLRMGILFKEFPDIAHAYHLSMMFRSWYELRTTKE